MARTPEAAVVIGTRPEAIKLAPVVTALRAQGRIAPWVVSTGQHREMLEQSFAALELVPDIELGVMRPDQTLSGATARILEATSAAFAERRPAWVVVQGDTTTAFAAALAAFHLKIPVAHVEAGLRSGDPDSPFPEEVNRRLVDQLSALRFAPTHYARDLLAAEGIVEGVHVTGNTVVDALRAARQRVARDRVAIGGLCEAVLAQKRVVLLTAHRRESLGAPLEGIFRAVRRLVRSVPDTCVIYPVHLNPAVQATARAILGDEPRVHLLAPLGYLEFVALLERADLVLTDSGGVQEEAPAFGKPLLVLRDTTERPEGIEAGVARLIGTDEERIFAEAVSVLRDDGARRRLLQLTNPYGDGHAGERIASLLAEALAGGRQGASAVSAA